MCLNPLTIRSNKTDFSLLRHRSFLQVPCGSCSQCREVRKNGYMTRLSFAFDETTKAHGKVLFLTFTYNDAHLPYLTYKGVNQPCFSKKDTAQLFKSLHRYYDKKGLKFKQFFVSEYGSNTKRPHYHCIFFLESNINDVEFAEKCREYWTHMYIKDKNIYTCNGFMFPSKTDVLLGKHLCRSNVGLSFYAAKYTCKDLSFYNIPIISDIVKSKSDKYKDFMPHMRISSNLGAKSLCEYVINNPTATKITNPCTGKLVNIPSYVFNKVCYDFHRSERISDITKKPIVERKLNNFGLSRLIANLGTLIENKVNQYISLDSNVLKSDAFKASIFHYVYKGFSSGQINDFFWSDNNIDFYKPDSYLPFYVRQFLTDNIDLYSLDDVIVDGITNYLHSDVISSKSNYYCFYFDYIAKLESRLESRLLELRKNVCDYTDMSERFENRALLYLNPNLDKQIGDDACIY